MMPRRSVLYVPADKPRAIDKARGLAPDAVILDLEDAVAPDAKEAAREAMRAAASAGGFRGECVVRINAMDTEWGAEDLLAAIASRPDAVLIPKVCGARDISLIAEALEDCDAPETLRLWAMIETPAALLDLPAIAAAARLDAFVIGTNDLAAATRVPLTPDRAAYLPWFMGIMAAARAHGLDVIDGVCGDFRDAARLEAECRQARALGMDGKSLIHPAQIEAANRIFAPSIEELAEARAIVDAFGEPENAGKGVIALDGRMVERLHLGQAERLLAIAGRIRMDS